jgi:hypothetical protein|tara:strand:+ start:4425 stop:4595 length:171 start_codon:yes stop_codon:yes gene_type:complete
MIILAIAILVLCVLGLSLGVILSDKPLRVSCGGNFESCDLCKGDSKKCTKNKLKKT